MARNRLGQRDGVGRQVGCCPSRSDHVGQNNGVHRRGAGPPPSSSSSPDNRAGPHDPKPQAAACSVLCEPTQELLLLLASVALVPQPAVGSLSRVQANTPTLRWANQESSLLYRARLPQVSLYPGEAPCIQVCCALLSGLVCSPSCAAFHEACAHKPLLSKC